MHISCNGTQARIPTAQFASFYQVDSAVHLGSGESLRFVSAASLDPTFERLRIRLSVHSHKISEPKVFQTAAKQTI